MLLKNNVGAQSVHPGMGTVMTHKAFGRYAAESLVAVRSEAARLEELLSRFLPQSDISRVNRAAGGYPERVSRDTFEVLVRALEFSRQCRGYFSATVGPLVALWSRAKETGCLPEDVLISQVLPLVDDSGLVLDPIRRTATLQAVGQFLDLGGIGKGFAADRFLEVFRDFGISSAYSNIGGNVVVLGTRPDGSPWRVGIQHPRQEDRLVGLVAVVDKTVVTSGDYQRFYTDNQGIRRHHILDPLTGYPAEAGLVSVSIIADNSLAADALSTALFVAGLEKGLEILGNYPGTEAVFVDRELRVFITPGLVHSFQAGEGIDVSVVKELVRSI